MHELFYRGRLNPQHPWFEAYWPSLAHKIVTTPDFLAKLVTWLRCDIEPQYPILISAGPDHIRGVVGTTRLAAALLRSHTWRTQIRCVSNTLDYDAPWGIIDRAKAVKPFSLQSPRLRPPQGWRQELEQSRRILCELELKEGTPLEIITQLDQALVPQSGPKKI